VKRFYYCEDYTDLLGRKYLDTKHNLLAQVIRLSTTINGTIYKNVYGTWDGWVKFDTFDDANNHILEALTKNNFVPLPEHLKTLL